jgi:SPX domain protein involved in polyphosphate accumulation
MAIEVFNRYEQKYMINEKNYLMLQNALPDYMELDAYNRLHETYSITNIYYDTNDSQLIRNSLAKPVYKEKLRLRAYGTPQADSKVYLEIKKKFRGLVNKRRSSLQLDAAGKFIETGELPEFEPYMNKQVLHEIEYILKLYKLSPALFLSYDRRAYFVKGQNDLRASFDTNILSRQTDLKLESGIYGEPLLEKDQWIMEIKSASSMPIWLAQLLSEHKIYPISFSKYGTAYKHSFAEQMVQDFGAFEFNPARISVGALIPT